MAGVVLIISQQSTTDKLIQSVKALETMALPKHSSITYRKLTEEGHSQDSEKTQSTS